MPRGEHPALLMPLDDRATRYLTLDDRFDPRRNSLNALRLILAVAVIVSHTWALGDYGDEPAIGGYSLGGWAVTGFFGISGYLIIRSRLRTGARTFYRARFLRIYPGYLAAMLVTAFAFAPLIGAFGGGTYSLGSAASYVVRNLFLFPPHLGQPGIGDLLAGRAYPWMNGSVWTLFWEAACYVLAGVAVSIVPRRWLAAAAVAVFTITTTVLAIPLAASGVGLGDMERPLRLLAPFLAGACLALLGSRIPFRLAAGSAATLLFATVAGGCAGQLAGLPFTFLLIAASVVIPLGRVGARHDISYGVYIYGWPVQQLLVVLGLHLVVPPLLFAAVAVVTVLPLAWASFVLVERPAINLGRRFARGTPSALRSDLVVDVRAEATPAVGRAGDLEPLLMPGAVGGEGRDAPVSHSLARIAARVNVSPCQTANDEEGR